MAFNPKTMFNTEFNIGGTVYMVSSPGQPGWVPGKVYKGIVEENDGKNVTARFPDGSIVTQTVEKLRQQTLDFGKGRLVINLTYANLSLAFAAQEAAGPGEKPLEWYIGNLERSKIRSEDQTLGEVREIFSNLKGGWLSNRKKTRRKHRKRRTRRNNF